MKTAVARELESDHQEGEGRPTLGLAPADTKRHEREADPVDASQGQRIGSSPYEDPTQGRQIGSSPYEDPTQGRQIGSRPHDDPTQAR
jgi:hypothetical protein